MLLHVPFPHTQGRPSLRGLDLITLKYMEASTDEAGLAEVELVYFDGCPHWRSALEHLEDALGQVGRSDSLKKLTARLRPVSMNSLFRSKKDAKKRAYRTPSLTLTDKRGSSGFCGV